MWIKDTVYTSKNRPAGRLQAYSSRCPIVEKKDTEEKLRDQIAFSCAR
jgi:hypothetical protein